MSRTEITTAELHFSVLGFYEDFIEQDTARYLGRRTIEWPTRTLGSGGMIDVEIRETFVLQRNLKNVTYRASKDKPLRVRCIEFQLCGRVLKPGDKVRVRRTKEEQLRSLAPKEGIIRTFDTGVPGLIGLRAGNIEWSEPYWRVSLVEGKVSAAEYPMEYLPQEASA